MSWEDAFKVGLSLAGGGLAGAGTFALTGNPALGIGVGGQVGGTLMQTLGADTRQTGPTDAQIASAEASARQAQGARIEAQNRRAQQQLRSQAGARGLAGSGLYSRGAADINAGTAGAYTNLDAQLAQNRLGILSQRRYVPNPTGLSVGGHLLGSFASPIAMLGAASLARDGYGGGAGRGGATRGPVNFGGDSGWRAPQDFSYSQQPDVTALGRFGNYDAHPLANPDVWRNYDQGRGYGNG